LQYIVPEQVFQLDSLGTDFAVLDGKSGAAPTTVVKMDLSESSA